MIRWLLAAWRFMNHVPVSELHRVFSCTGWYKDKNGVIVYENKKEIN